MSSSSCLSVRLPLNGFPLDLISEDFSKIFEEIMFD